VFILDSDITNSLTVHAHFKSPVRFRYKYHKHGTWAYHFSNPLFLQKPIKFSFYLFCFF